MGVQQVVGDLQPAAELLGEAADEFLDEVRHLLEIGEGPKGPQAEHVRPV